MNSITIFSLLILCLMNVASAATLPTDTTDVKLAGEKSQIDETGIPPVDYLINGLEQVIKVLRATRISSAGANVVSSGDGKSGDPLAVTHENGAGCADCDTIAALIPISGLLESMQRLFAQLMTALTRVTQNQGP